MKITFFKKEERLPMPECSVSDMVVIDLKGDSQLHQTKYSVFFNGQPDILDIRDILYLESYYRKTSVVTVDGPMRIRARLDEEEKKFPNEWFIRINRHNIINMKYVRNVKGEKVEMHNGDILYVNLGRRKKFQKKYMDFLKRNCMIL